MLSPSLSLKYGHPLGGSSGLFLWLPFSPDLKSDRKNKGKKVHVSSLPFTLTEGSFLSVPFSLPSVLRVSLFHIQNSFLCETMFLSLCNRILQDNKSS